MTALHNVALETHQYLTKWNNRCSTKTAALAAKQQACSKHQNWTRILLPRKRAVAESLNPHSFTDLGSADLCAQASPAGLNPATTGQLVREQSVAVSCWRQQRSPHAAPHDRGDSTGKVILAGKE